MSKQIIQFKNPDLISDILRDKFPGDWEDPKVEQAREEFGKKWFEYGDYGRIEIDTVTLEAKLVPMR